MAMIITIQQAVYPLLLISSIFGLVTALKVEVWFQSVSNAIYVRTGVLTTIISVIMGIRRDKRFRLFMKRLAAIDDTLEELGTPKSYGKLHEYAKRVLIGWLVCTYMGNTFDMIWWFSTVKDRRSMILPFIINHVHNVNMLMDLLLIIFLWYIGTRFDKINEHMKHLLVEKDYGLQYSWKKTMPITRRYMYTDYKCILWTSMHLHLELCQIARELNTMFGLQMTIQMAAYLIYVARLCDYILMHLRTEGRYIPSSFVWVGMHFWIFIYLARLFSLNYICDKVSVKANKMEKIIHQLTNSIRYADVSNEIYQFTLQLIHHPLKFTGLGLFYFGNNLLRKFITTITTFIVILAQMSTPKSGTEF